MQVCRDASMMAMRRIIRGKSAEEIKNLKKGAALVNCHLVPCVIDCARGGRLDVKD